MQQSGQRGGLMARTGTKQALRETIQTIVVAIVLALVIRTWVVEPFEVHGTSMQNTLQNHERLLVNKFWWHVSPPTYGDIVVFLPPVPGVTEDYVKRVIGTGGQTVSMRDGQVYVNGHRMPQPFLVHGGVSTMDHFTMAPVKVPKGDIFVLGDHRANSEDSRYFGVVKLSALQGIAFWAFWPLSAFGPIH